MTDSKNTHDAQKMLSDFKDHLGRYNKPITFIFGAGTSCSVRVPDSNDRTNTQAFIPQHAASQCMLCKVAG